MKLFQIICADDHRYVKLVGDVDRNLIKEVFVTTPPGTKEEALEYIKLFDQYGIYGMTKVIVEGRESEDLCILTADAERLAVNG